MRECWNRSIKSKILHFSQARLLIKVQYQCIRVVVNPILIYTSKLLIMLTNWKCKNSNPGRI